MGNAKIKSWVVSIAVLAAAVIGVIWIRRPRSASPAGFIVGAGPAEPSVQNSSQPAPGQTGLALGTPHREGKSLTVPVHFTGAKGARVGNIHAELDVPAGPWVFQSASVPKTAFWNVTAGRAAPDQESPAQQASNTQVIELDVDGGSQAIRNGLICFLIFSAQSDGASPQVSAAVAELETLPPQGDEGQGSSGKQDIEEPPNTGPENPAMGCFFFTH